MGMGVTMIRFLGFNVRIEVHITTTCLYLCSFKRLWLECQIVLFTLRVICNYILCNCTFSTEDLYYSLWGGRTRGGSGLLKKSPSDNQPVPPLEQHWHVFQVALDGQCTLNGNI